MKEPVEYILCAATWYKEATTAHTLPANINQGVVVCGLTHAHCIHTFVALTGKRSVQPECGEYEHGFITSWNRFVRRVEAGNIALAAGQIEHPPATLAHGQLDSSDLYGLSFF